jgi:hypothetical protein
MRLGLPMLRRHSPTCWRFRVPPAPGWLTLGVALGSLLLPAAARTEDASADLAAASGYLRALRLHIEPNPALATAYLAFWSAVGEGGGLDTADTDPPASPSTDTGAGTGTSTDPSDERWSRIVAATTGVATAVRQRYGADATSYRLLDTLQVAAGTLAAGRSGPAPEALLRLVDRQVAPRIDANGRYSFGGELAGIAQLGAATELWQRCRASTACADAHDALFGEAMGGISIRAALEDRLTGDGQLARQADTTLLRAALGAAAARLPGRSGEREPALLAVADNVWRLVDAGRQSGTGANAPASLNTLLTVGSAAASLGTSPPRAGTFTVLRQPLQEAVAAAGGSRPGSWLAATARLGLLLAGGQALALFDTAAALGLGPAGSVAPAVPPPELTQLVAGLFEQTSRDLAALRTEVIVAGNATDTRLAALALSVDVLKDDVARIESTQQAQVRGAFAAAEARRWTAFDEDNERCFALRNRDPRSGQLRTAEFRRCEDRFLQGAVRRSQYATRSTDFVLQGRYLEPADLQFPFHAHYPLLLIRGGTDQRAALALPDPVEWLQQASALLRLYQENPATPADDRRRAEVLRQVRAAGARINGALDGLVTTRAADGQAAFRADLHDQFLDTYFESLERLIARVGELDSGDADPYGKRLTATLDQPLPGGRKAAAIAARLDAPAIAPCNSSDAAAFEAPPTGVAAESRRFFDSPITAAELATHWNRERVAGLALAAPDLTAMVQPAWVWAALEGLGTLDACLLAFRPEAVEFSRDDGPGRDTFRGQADVSARVAVRFTPGAALAQVPGWTAGTPVVLAERTALRRCTFGYRRDGEGCSRARCLADLAPEVWAAAPGNSADGPDCSGASFAGQVVAAGPAGGAVPQALADAYWARRAAAGAALANNVRRSAPFDQAEIAYREYFALAAVTLGIYADGGAALAPLLERDGPLAPAGVVAALVTGRRDPAELQQFLQAERRRLAGEVRRRGTEITTAPLPGFGLPPLRTLGAGVGRVDLMLAAYAD